MSFHHPDLLAWLWLLGGSFLMPVVSGRFRVPSAVLLIIFGCLAGPHVFNAIPECQVVDFLYEIGFMVLMFLAGLEIDFNGIRRRGSQALVAMVIICGLIFVLAFLAAWFLGLHPLYGLALGAISVGMPLAVLKETGRLRGNLGQNVVLLGSVGEFLTVIALTLFYFGSRYGFSLRLVMGLGKLLGILILAAIVLRLLMAIAWWQPLRFSKLVEKHDGSEMGVRASMLLMMLFSMLAILAGVESIVGAFVAGAVIAFVLRGKEILEEKLAVVGHGLFVPIFFIIVGMRFDPGLVSAPVLALSLILTGVAFVIRLIPCLGLLRFGLSAVEMLGVVSLLAAPLTLVVAISVIGKELRVLDEVGRGALIVFAVMSGGIFPVVFRLLAGSAPPPGPPANPVLS